MRISGGIGAAARALAIRLVAALACGSLAIIGSDIDLGKYPTMSTILIGALLMGFAEYVVIGPCRAFFKEVEK